jgi:hypothetical protein
MLFSRPWLVAQGAALQLALRGFDGLTIWFCFFAVGIEAPLWASFAAIVLGNAAMFFTPVPMGLGTFEAGCVATLTLAGLPRDVADRDAALSRTFVLNPAHSGLLHFTARVGADQREDEALNGSLNFTQSSPQGAACGGRAAR